jgi:hypothetical protein
MPVREAEFREWLEANGANTPDGRNTRVYAVKTIEKKLSELGFDYPDLEAAWQADRLAGVRQAITDLRADFDAGGTRFRILMPESGMPRNRLSSWRSWLGQYGRFLGDAVAIGSGDVRGTPLDRQALERLKARFLEAHPDFVTFEDSPSFAATEGNYKRALVEEAGRRVAALAEEGPDVLGRALIDLLVGRGGLYSNLIDRWALKVIDKAFADYPGQLERAAGILARAEDGAEAISAFLEEVWTVMRGDLPSNPYAESRMFPTMLRALVHPAEVLPIRSTPTYNAVRALIGEPTFANAPLSREELARVNAMARAIMRVMDEEWDWRPRDMWDVQGFIWVACQKKPDAGDQPQTEKEQPVEPTNLILYGPPGTGKTYRTAREAVRLCGEAVPGDRAALMLRYEELSKAGRIRFVTFHQSFSYEEFVEGLRPSTGGKDAAAGGEGTASGFELKVHDGIFKRIANDAAADTGGMEAADLLDQAKPVIRLGLPQANRNETFERFIGEGFIGWPHGGDYDWSAPEFEDWEAIKERRKRDEPELLGNNIKIFGTWLFRSTEPGTYVMLTSGWGKVHALGRIAGDYEYHPQATDEWARHRRRVEWLWDNAEGVPRETLYPNAFTTFHAAYALDNQLINWDVLNRLVFGDEAVAEAAAARRPYVLIIDEINRGNVSKVFGELITLIEPDKRLGKDNRLKVTLPYSGHEFGVPANLHIIGTMNTADRSIALLDTALRRRFRFEEIAPEPELLGIVDGIDLPAVLTAMNRRIEYLVDRDHRIGHAFFIDCKTKADVDAAMRDKVIPLLQEYFFDDWNRLAAVLGEKKEKGGNFIDCEKLRDPMGEGRDPINSWRVRQSFDEGAYDRLIAGASAQPSEAEGEV